MLSLFLGVVCTPAVYADTGRDVEVPHLSAISIRCLTAGEQGTRPFELITAHQNSMPLTISWITSALI